MSLIQKSCSIFAAFIVVACTGDKGPTGSPGTPGTDGAVSLAGVTAEPAGANCAAGGQKIESGVDDDHDGTLQPGEVDTTTYVCNGDGGLASLVAVTVEPAGANCAAGGQKIESGVDENGDGVLQAGEVDDTAYVCSGSDGIDANTGLFGEALENLVVSAIEVTNTAGSIGVTFHVEDAATGDAFTELGIYDQSVRAYIASHVPAGRATATSFADTTSPVVTWDTPFLERWAYQRNRDRAGDFALDISDAANGNYGLTLDADEATFTALEAGNTNAVDYVANDTQRLLLRVDGRDFGYNRTIGLLDFDVPAADASTTGLAALERVIVDRTACESCHNDPLERAAHGGGYQSPQACNICHTPIGDQYGDRMQNHDTWSAKLFHQLHSAIPNAAHPDRIDGTGYAAVRFPGDMMNCETCHFDNGQDLADSWKSNPTMQVCTNCHTTVVFDGTTSYTQLNGDTHTHLVATDNSGCDTCHTGIGLPTAAGNTMDVVTAHAPHVRSMRATITDVEVEAGTGNVIATFTVDDAGTAVTAMADFNNGLALSLARLELGTGGASNHWESYTGRARTKDVAQPPVIQGYSENSGTLASPSSGVFTYTFALVNANTDGDITSNMNNVVNVSTVGGPYGGAALQTVANVVVYDPTLTHRVGMEFTEADGTPNLTNATFDFVPDGTTPLETREIVTIDKCNNCHGGVKLHKGYAVEYCVTCHNQGTFDPFSGDAPVTVDLQTMVHKIHMGFGLPSVKAGGSYVVNGSHDYSNLVVPQAPNNCLMCHDESNADGANWRNNPTSRACGTCHDSVVALAHIASNSDTSADETEACAVCHGPDRIAPVEHAHYGVSQ